MDPARRVSGVGVIDELMSRSEGVGGWIKTDQLKGVRVLFFADRIKPVVNGKCGFLWFLFFC